MDGVAAALCLAILPTLLSLDPGTFTDLGLYVLPKLDWSLSPSPSPSHVVVVVVT